MKMKEMVACELCDEALSWRNVLTIQGYQVCSGCRLKAEKLEMKPTVEAPAPVEVPPAPLVFLYRNHNGELAERHVIPKLVRFGTSEHHPGGRWLLEAEDLDRKAHRTFALENVTHWGPAPEPGDLEPLDPRWFLEIAAGEPHLGSLWAAETLEASSVTNINGLSATMIGKGACAVARLLCALSPKVAGALAALLSTAR